MSEIKKTRTNLFRPWSEVHSFQDDRRQDPGLYTPLKLLKHFDQALPTKQKPTTAVTVTPPTSTTIPKQIEQTRKEAKVEKPVVKEGNKKIVLIFFYLTD